MFGKLSGLGDIASLIKNAGKIEGMMKETQEKLAKIEITGSAGADAVQVKMNAQGYALSVMIDDAILKEDKIILQDLVAAAINDAAQKIEKEKQNLLGSAGGMFGGMMPKSNEEEK
jgi:hypothetical protein